MANHAIFWSFLGLMRDTCTGPNLFLMVFRVVWNTFDVSVTLLWLYNANNVISRSREDLVFFTTMCAYGKKCDFGPFLGHMWGTCTGPNLFLMVFRNTFDASVTLLWLYNAKKTLFPGPGT